jgi:hypothetical protein
MLHGRNSTLLLIAYFAGLAILIGGLASVGIKPTEQTVITGMAITAGIFALVWAIWKLIKRQLRKFGYSGKQWLAVMTGAPAEVVDAMPGSGGTSLVSVGGTDLAFYDDGEPGDDWDTFIEPDGLELSDTFKPSIHSLLGQMVAVFGIRRSGKSNCVSVIIEALAPSLLPILVCDTKDEFAGLVNPQIMPHAVMAGAPGASANVPDDVKFHYIPVDEGGAFQFGQALMEGTFQCVLNLKSYETDDEAAKVMCGIIGGINYWQEKRANKDRIPVEVVLSEGHKWLPQNESNEISKDVQILLHKTFFSTIVRLGGAYGFGLIVDSQRPSELDKRCLQSTWKFLFKQSETIDIKKYEEYNLTREAVLSLQPGECFVFSPSVLGFPVKMYRKRSPDLSMTPGLEQLVKHRQVAHAKHRMLAQRRSYTIALPPEDEAFLQQAASFLVRNPDGSARKETPAPIVPEKGPRAEDIPMERAIHAWNSGVNTVSRIEQVWGLTNHQARRLRQMVLDRGGVSLENDEQVLSSLNAITKESAIVTMI